MPINRPFVDKDGNPLDSENKYRELDRLVVEEMVRMLESKGGNVQTVRAPYQEGDTVFPGSQIYCQSHVQIAVRDYSCIDPKVWRVAEGEFTV